MKAEGVELTVPIGLTAARIQRANPAIGEEAAQTLALELHDIIGWVRKFYSVQPDPEASALSEEIDLVETLMRTAVDVWPADPAAAANESIWIAERFMEIGADELYDRYLGVCDRITGEAVS